MTGLLLLPLRHTGNLSRALRLAHTPRGSSDSSSFYGHDSSLFDWSIRFSPAAVSQKQKCTPCSPTDAHPPSSPIVTMHTLDAMGCSTRLLIELTANYFICLSVQWHEQYENHHSLFSCRCFTQFCDFIRQLQPNIRFFLSS